MQPHQRYLLSLGGRYFLVCGQPKGDAAGMGAFALEILPLIRFLLEFINLNEMNTNKVVFATDFSVADSLNSIKDY